MERGHTEIHLPSRIYGQACATYESASLRMFHLGRTDTIRSASMDSLAFVKAMDEPTVPVRGLGPGWVGCAGSLCAPLWYFSPIVGRGNLTEDGAMNVVLSFLAE